MGQRQSNGIYQMSKFSSFVFNIISKWLICLKHTCTHTPSIWGISVLYFTRFICHFWFGCGNRENVECRCCNMFKLSCIVEVNPFYCYSTLSIELRASIHTFTRTNTLAHTHMYLYEMTIANKKQGNDVRNGGTFFATFAIGFLVHKRMAHCAFNLSFVPMQHRISLLRLNCRRNMEWARWEENGIEKWKQKWKETTRK